MDVRPSQPIPGSSSGADLNGWSALPLLGHVTDSGVPWLFLSSISHAWVSRGAVADAQFVEQRAAYDGPWPFRDRAVGGVVIDGDALAREAGDAVLPRILTEANRVSDGNVLVVCADRVMPRRLRAWRELGRRTAGRWQSASSRAGLTSIRVGGVALDGQRVTEVTCRGGAVEREVLREPDRVVMRVAADRQDADDVLAALVTDASRRSGMEFRVERVAVRKIGKTVAFLSDVHGSRHLMRIARSPVALARATRNFETLASLHRSSLPDWVRAAAPSALVRGTEAGYAYFVESCLPGRPGPGAATSGRAAQAWIADAVKYIFALHQATRRRVPMDDIALTGLVREPVARVLGGCATRDAERVLRRLQDICEHALEGCLMPLVLTHGDFTESNCLFDTQGRLTAVVDWELSVPEGLPFVDLLQLMPVASETSSHPRWQRFDAWMDLYRRPDRADRDPVMSTYLRDFDVPRDTIPALILLQWVAHVADRIDARRDDERWMRRRVWQPLESLSGIVSD